MLRRAKILLAGTTIAIPLWLLSAGAATSQSAVVSDQVQLGDVFASQTLDVVTQDDTAALTTATGNSLSGTVQSGSADFVSHQSVSGAVQAATTVNVSDYAGADTVMTTAATGNTSDAGIDSGGVITGQFFQSSTGPLVQAESQLNADAAQADNVSQSTQAIGNSHGFGATDSAINSAAFQTNSADVISDGGAVVNWIPGDGAFSSVASGNNVSSVAVGGANTFLGVTQSQTGGVVQGAQFTNLGTSQSTITSATATGNNMSATNEQGVFDVTDSQDNQAYVHAQAVETSFEYGGATATAYGVGNSALAGNYGPSLVLNNTQVNGTGGVEASASFEGFHGYDATASSTAMGNAVTGYACSQCGGVMTVHNSQTNAGDAAATSQLSLTGAGRSARGVATSVGNNATFYVTKPGN